MIYEPMVRSGQSVQLSCTNTNTLQMDRNELPLEPCNLVLPLGASKTIYVPMVCLAQTMDLSCIDTNTVSKWIEMRFHMTNISKEIHQVRPKRFPSLWYSQRKPCTYLASRLALSPNGPKRAFTCASSPRSNVRCVQKDCWVDVTFSANHAPILH